MKEQSSEVIQAWKLLLKNGIILPDFVKALTEFDILYQTPEGFKRMPAGNEGPDCIARGFFPFNYASFTPNVPYDAFLLFDEEAIDDIKEVNVSYVPWADVWAGIMLNKDHINAFLSKLKQTPLEGTYLAYAGQYQHQPFFVECKLESASGCEHSGAIQRCRYPSGKGPIKYRVGGFLKGNRIYAEWNEGCKGEMVLPATNQQPQEEDFPFDLLCTSDDGRRLFRLPYAQGKDRNPIAIFFSQENPKLYLELNETENTIRSNVKDAHLPPYTICEEIWRVSEKLNPCLRALGKPELKGCYFAQQGKGNLNWIVQLNSAEGGADMPSDYYDTNEHAKARYVGCL